MEYAGGMESADISMHRSFPPLLSSFSDEFLSRLGTLPPAPRELNVQHVDARLLVT